MKIALVSNPYINIPPERYGGIEQIVYLLSEGLVKNGHEVHLYATGKSKTSSILHYLYLDETWPIDHRVGTNHYSFAFYDIIRQGDFDIVHCHDANALPFTRFSKNLPCVHTVHHVKDESISKIYQYFPDVHYITISEYQRKKEIPLKYVRTIYHGLKVEYFKFNENPKNYLAFLGRISKIKGLHNAIKVAKATNNELRIGGPVHWVDEPYFNEEIKPYIDNKKIIHLGNLNLEEKVELLKNAKATLFPIEWDEPFGLVMIESMLCGTPVIAFPKGSVPEIVEEGITGFIANNIDEMIDLIKSDRLNNFNRKKCAERARERFNANKFIEEHEKYYMHVIENSKQNDKESVKHTYSNIK
jgi:glycosyltransferase involved in cell wall biosynthesis